MAIAVLRQVLSLIPASAEYTYYEAEAMSGPQFDQFSTNLSQNWSAHACVYPADDHGRNDGEDLFERRRDLALSVGAPYDLGETRVDAHQRGRDRLRHRAERRGGLRSVRLGVRARISVSGGARPWAFDAALLTMNRSVRPRRFSRVRRGPAAVARPSRAHARPVWAAARPEVQKCGARAVEGRRAQFLFTAGPRGAVRWSSPPGRAA